MKIHAIQTGSVALTASWREGVGHGRRRLLNTLLDREWTDPLPIYAFAIEHPEGVIVVDTGETARVAEPGYFPRWSPFLRFAVREQVERDEEIGPQLERLGIRPGDVRWVVMTHLHTDHAGGLPHFANSEILVSRTEMRYATGLRGRLRGYVNKPWPAWFDPILVDLSPAAFGPFPTSLPLTRAGDVTLVPVPGHSPGQLAEDAMLRGAVDGVGADEHAERLTHERIRAYAAATPTVYLPSHDPETAVRLAERRTVGAVERRAAA
jgi:N-acyl homoserine lactone hydrolase